jgi:WD40 repeat protein/tetratricopeptide (TPR) repeat protein
MAFATTPATHRPSGLNAMTVWDAANGKQVAYRRLSSGDVPTEVGRVGGMAAGMRGIGLNVASVAFTSDGRRLVTVANDGTIDVWDTTNWKKTASHRGSGGFRCAALSADARQLATASWDRTVRVQDIRSGQVTLTIDGEAWRSSPMLRPDAIGAQVWAGLRAPGPIVTFSHDGRRTASTSRDGKAVRISDAASGQEISTLGGHTEELLSVALSPDGRRLAAGGARGTVWVWDTAARQATLTLRWSGGAVLGLEFSPDGKRLACCGQGPGAAVKVWDTSNGLDAALPVARVGTIDTVAISPDGTRILTTCTGAVANGRASVAGLWDAATGKPIDTALTRPNEPAWSTGFSPDGRTILTLGARGARLWDAVTGEPIRVKGGPPSSLTFGPDGRIFAIGVPGVSGAPRMPGVVGAPDENSRARLWDLAEDRPLGAEAIYRGPGSSFMTPVLNPDGRTFVQSNRLWSAATGKPIGKPPFQPSLFSPDGRMALSVAVQHWQLWDMWSGKPVGPPIDRANTNWQDYVAFLDAHTLLSASPLEGVVRLWDVAAVEEGGGALREPPLVYRAVFNGDGRAILTADPDPPNDSIQSVKFSPDGRTILTFNRQAAQLWDTRSGRPAGPLVRWGPRVVQSRSRTERPSQTPRFMHTGWMEGDDSGTRRNVALAQLGGSDPGSDPNINQHSPIKSTPGFMGAAFRVDGPAVLVDFHDSTANLWDAVTAKRIGLPMQHTGLVAGAAFSADGRTLMTWESGPSSSARLWDVATARPIGGSMPHQGDFAPQLSSDGRTVLTRVGYVQVQLWEGATGQRAGPPLPHQAPVAPQFGPDGQSLLTWDQDDDALGRWRLWDVATITSIGTLKSEAPGLPPAFSPDGRMLVSAWDGRVWLWDARTARPTETSLPAGVVRFGHDGRFVVSASAESVQTWDIAQRRLVHPPVELQRGERLWSREFSPDGRMLLSTGDDGHLRFLGTATGRWIGPRLEPSGQKVNAVFSPDGASIVTSSDQGVQLWDFREWDDAPPRVTAWVERITGLAISQVGEIQALDAAAWRARSDALAKLGGSPEPAPRLSIAPDPLNVIPAERARELVGRARPDDLVGAMDEVISSQPTNADTIYERGRLHEFYGSPQEADADFIDAFALGHRGRELLDRLVTNNDRFYRAIARSKDDPDALLTLRMHRAGCEARQHRFETAAAEYAGVLAPESQDPWLRWYQTLCLRAAGDQEGLRLAREEMLAPNSNIDEHMDDELIRFKWGGSESPIEMAWISALAPGTEDDFDIAARLAHVAVNSPRAGDLLRQGIGGMVRMGGMQEQKRPHIRGPMASRAAASPGDDREAIARITLGAVLYRAGSHNEAVEALEHGVRQREGVSTPPDWAFLAMAHHRLGHREEARRWLDRLRARRPSTHPAAFWDELEIRLLQSEAEAMILFDPVFPDDPFAH